MSATLTRTSRKARKPPICIREGSVEVKIYVTPETVDGVIYEQFTLCYYLGSKRIRQKFSDLEEAKKEAQVAALKMSNAEHDALKLSSSDRAVYVQCLDRLRPLGLPLGDAVADYVAAVTKLPPGASLADAVADYAKRHPANMTRKTVAEAVAEMINDRRTAGCSVAHMRDLENRLGRFADAFQVPIASLSAPMVRDYLRTLAREDGVPVTNRTRRNVQRIVTSLFHFCRKQRFVTRELVDEIAEIESPKMEAVETGVFTPEQLRKMLFSAPDDIRAALAIGAFCGLRTAELARLDWSEVQLAERVIIIGADKAKTASRRTVPISDNCAAWLAPLVRKEGKVSPAPTDRAMNHRFARSAAKQGVVWVKNGLRHSFCSYQLAVTRDAARVANEAGNSPAMLHKNYKALVTEAQGKDWFSILPALADDVIPLPLAVSA